MKTQSTSINILYFFGTTFYSGKISGPKGTYSSFIACIIAFFMMKINVFVYFFICIALFFAGLYIVHKLLPFFESDDPHELNIDEFACQFFTFIYVSHSILHILIGFALFRFFDIIKPLGIKRLEKIKGAYGVMLDDLAGAIIANVILQLFILFHNKFF